MDAIPQCTAKKRGDCRGCPNSYAPELFDGGCKLQHVGADPDACKKEDTAAAPQHEEREEI